jgi:hypothetical protein
MKSRSSVDAEPQFGVIIGGSGYRLIRNDRKMADQELITAVSTKKTGRTDGGLYGAGR